MARDMQFFSPCLWQRYPRSTRTPVNRRVRCRSAGANHTDVVELVISSHSSRELSTPALLAPYATPPRAMTAVSVPVLKMAPCPATSMGGMAARDMRNTDFKLISSIQCRRSSSMMSSASTTPAEPTSTPIPTNTPENGASDGSFHATSLGGGQPLAQAGTYGQVARSRSPSSSFSTGSPTG